MRIIDRLIENSKPFQMLRYSTDTRVNEALNDHKAEIINQYADRVQKLVDLTERVHNTILSVKHTQESL